MLELIAQGHANPTIAGLLFLTPRTVETHVGNIFNKLGLPPDPGHDRRVLAVLACLRGH